MALSVSTLARGLRCLPVLARGVAYKAPQRDIDFVLHEVLDLPAHAEKLGYKDVNRDLVQSLVGECAKFSEGVLSPLDHVGDQQGCKLGPNNNVSTPKGFKDAYVDYVAGGWAGLTVPREYGGEGLPLSLGLIKAELIGTANWAWGMYPGLSIGAMNTLLLHASEEQKKTYVTQLASGNWMGTMCLTEPQCGTDLAQVKTKAVRQADGSFKLTGTKIFISCGEHDMSENIIHIVLARIEGAPSGTRGISLFLCPKHLIKPDGSLAKEKNLLCTRLENKMGIHGSSTAEMTFENSTGFLIGKENQGLHQMFTFMNTARVGTALQGLGAAELAYQGASRYARDRLAMRALTGPKFPNKVADPILVHPDVRRMLLTAKALAEGGRCMVYYTAMLADNMLTADESSRGHHDDYLGLFTPILKGFLTEAGQEAANHGIQVFGGHGFIRENGMEQILRDARISTLYEGTTGVQALDLLGRKILLGSPKNLLKFNKEILAYAKKVLIDDYKTSHHKLEAAKVAWHSLKWVGLSARLALHATRNRDIVGSASVDYLMFSGYTTMAYFWLRMMETASAKLAASPEGPDAAFYKSKIATGKFFFRSLLPRTKAHAKAMVASPAGMMAVPEEQFFVGRE